MRAIPALATLTIAVALAAARAAETPSGPQSQGREAQGTAATPPAGAAGASRPATGTAKPSGTAKGEGKAKGKGKAEKKPEYKGPTEIDIRAAYSLRVERINAGSEKHLSQEAAARMRIRLIKVDFIECEPMAERTDVYLCNVLVESALGDGPADFKRVEAVLAKDDKAWVLR